MNALEKSARALALAHLNKTRQEAGHPPLRSIPRLWWSMYGNEWLAKAAPKSVVRIQMPKEAYDRLMADPEAAKKFLRENGIPVEEIRPV